MAQRQQAKRDRMTSVINVMYLQLRVHISIFDHYMATVFAQHKCKQYKASVQVWIK